MCIALPCSITSSLKNAIDVASSPNKKQLQGDFVLFVICQIIIISMATNIPVANSHANSILSGIINYYIYPAMLVQNFAGCIHSLTEQEYLDWNSGMTLGSTCTCTTKS